MKFFLILLLFCVSSLFAQQQQLSNTMAFNNSNPSVQVISNNRGNYLSNFNTSNTRRNSSNITSQANKVKPKIVTANNKSNIAKQTNGAANTNNVIRPRNRNNSENARGPNNRGNLGNINSNEDNNLGNQFNNQQLLMENNINPIQSQQSISVVEQNSKVSDVNNLKSNNGTVNLNIRSFSSSSASSKSKSQKHTFSKKLKKFERNFYGKIGAHKKSKHLVDVCFNWR